MFDGSFKATRKVNLSGRSSAAGSRQELVQQAKREREKRFELKRRGDAATKLQALVRRVAAAHHTRAAVFQELEAELSRVVSTVNVATTPLPSSQLESLLRQFLFAVPRRRAALEKAGIADPDRVRNVFRYIIAILVVSLVRGTREEGTNIIQRTKTPTWVYQIARIVELELEQVAQLDLDTAMSPDVLVLDTLTCTGRYTDTNEDLAAFTAMMSQVATSDKGYGVFDALSDVARRLRRLQANQAEIERVVQESRVVKAVTTVSRSTLDVARNDPRQQQILGTFARKVLFTPMMGTSPIMDVALPTSRSDVSPETRRREEPLMWTVALDYLLTQTQSATTPWQDRAVLVGNTLDLITRHNYHPMLLRSGIFLIARFVSPSLVSWAFDVPKSDSMEDVPIADDDDSFDLIEHDTTRNAAAAILSTVVSPEDENEMRLGIAALKLEQEIDAVRAQWQRLCFSDFSALSFVVLLKTQNMRQLGQDGQEQDAIQAMFSVYATVMLTTSRAHMLRVSATFAPPTPPVSAILSNLCVDAGTDLLGRLWLWMQQHHIGQRLKPSGESGGSARYRTADLEVLVVFNEIYSRTLLTLDDENFYSRQWPLALDRVNSVVAFLKQFAFDTCWNNSSGNSNGSGGVGGGNPSRSYDLALFAAVTTSVKLFNQLYDRDCRRSFAAEGAWLWPSMPTIKEAVDLAAMAEEDTAHGTHALYRLVSGQAATAHSRLALLLATVPQVLSFQDRIQLFQKLLEEDKASISNVRDEFSSAIQVRIRRDQIVDDTFEVFDKLCQARSPSALKARIKVTFINEQGLEEAGIDGGGVFKEFVDVLTKHAFSPEYGYFLATDEQLLYPNPAAHMLADTRQDVIARFRFLGRVLAKAVYENILVEPQFAAFFLNKLLGKYNYVDDLQSLDPALYKSLMQLKHLDGDVADLALSFSVTEKAFGEVVTRNLEPNGANIPVTNANKIQYMHVLANYKLNVVSKAESAAFLAGFRDLIPAPWIRMFAPAELQMLIGGSATKIDVADWKQHTAYGGGYHPSQPVIQWFWEIVDEEFAPEDRAALLKFITSCSRQPLLGFGQLAPQICIHQVRTDDDDRLPSSATCMNLLKLPTYSTKDIMRRKLLYAIRANAGFDLS